MNWIHREPPSGIDEQAAHALANGQRWSRRSDMLRRHANARILFRALIRPISRTRRRSGKSRERSSCELPTVGIGTTCDGRARRIEANPIAVTQGSPTIDEPHSMSDTAQVCGSRAITARTGV
ncbi:MAG: hypothetical protein AB7G76_00125 [Steroidobacteraceae bacterium]